MIRKLTLLLLDCVLIFLAVLGGLLCLSSTFPTLVLPKNSILLLLFSTPLFCSLFRLKKGRIFALVSAALLLFAVLYWFEELKNSFIRLIQLLLDQYTQAQGYAWMNKYYPQLEPGVHTDLKAAFSALALLQTWLFSLSLSRWKRTLPGALSLLLTILPCFVLLDKHPQVMPLLLVTFAVAVMALSQGVRRRAEEEAPVAIGIGAVGAALLLALLLWLIPYESYDAPVRWETISDQIQQIGMEIGNRSSTIAGLNSSARSVSLKRLSSLSSRSAPVMTVRADRSGLVYLRGIAFTGFDGSSWQIDSSVRWGSERLFPALGSDADAHYHVTTDHYESIVYTPYELTKLPDGSKTVSDAYLESPEKQLEYDLSAVQTLASAPEDEDYREWIENNCLHVPEQTRELLLDWWAAHGIPGTFGTDFDVHDVAERISYVSNYDRTPSRCPSDRDFCDWFLNDAETGYCVHYATCLTAMLRAFGQPARYVSGYICEAVAGESVDVTSLNAHAWTEYYRDGRWQVVDATPIGAAESAGNDPSESAPPVHTDNSDMPEATRRQHQPTEYTFPEETEIKEVAASTAPLSTQENTALPPAESEPAQLTWLWVLCGVALLLALLVLRRAIKRSLRLRRLAEADTNEQAVLLWKRYVQLCRCLRLKPDANWSRLAYKAVFSPHHITEEELAPLREEVDRQERILYWSGVAKRLYYCYIRALI